MRKYICKLFNFLLGLVKTVVKFVADTLKVLTQAVTEVLGEVLSGAGKLLLGSPLGLLLLGVGAYWLLSGSDDDEEVVIKQPTQESTSESPT